jgi:hypothetical protein
MQDSIQDSQGWGQGKGDAENKHCQDSIKKSEGTERKMQNHVLCFDAHCTITGKDTRFGPAITRGRRKSFQDSDVSTSGEEVSENRIILLQKNCHDNQISLYYRVAV